MERGIERGTEIDSDNDKTDVVVREIEFIVREFESGSIEIECEGWVERKD